MKTGKIVLIMAGAASAGMILGMLVAREKGSTLRKSIRKQGKKFASHAGAMFENGLVRLERIKNTLFDHLSGLEISRQKIHYN